MLDDVSTLFNIQPDYDLDSGSRQRVVGTETERIVQEVGRLSDESAAYAKMADAVNPYGDGHAAERICKVLLMTANRKAACIC